MDYWGRIPTVQAVRCDGIDRIAKAALPQGNELLVDEHKIGDLASRREESLPRNGTKKAEPGQKGARAMRRNCLVRGLFLRFFLVGDLQLPGEPS